MAFSLVKRNVTEIDLQSSFVPAPDIEDLKMFIMARGRSDS